MNFTSIRAVKMPSVVLIPTVIVTINKGYFIGDYRTTAIALRWLKFAIVARWG